MMVEPATLATGSTSVVARFGSTLLLMSSFPTNSTKVFRGLSARCAATAAANSADTPMRSPLSEQLAVSDDAVVVLRTDTALKRQFPGPSSTLASAGVIDGKIWVRGSNSITHPLGSVIVWSTMSRDPPMRRYGE